MAANRTLGAFWYATFTFNLGYTATASQTTILSRAAVDLRSLRLLLALGVGGLLLGLWRGQRLSFRGFLVLSLVNVEVYCATLSGRTYNHYALQVAPGLALLAGWVADAVAGHRPAVQLAACTAALIAACWLLPSTVIGLNWQRSVYPRPGDYYLTFVNEFILGSNHQWRWRDADAIARVTNFARKYNASADPHRTYFLATTKPWLFALLRPSYANKYMEWVDWYDVPQAAQEERANFDGRRSSFSIRMSRMRTKSSTEPCLMSCVPEAT